MNFKKHVFPFIFLLSPFFAYSQQQTGSPEKLSQSKYYKLCSKALADIDAITDTVLLKLAWLRADSLTMGYIYDWPDKPQGYAMRVMAAKKIDRDTALGLAIEPINMYMRYMVITKDTADTYRQIAFNNMYYLFLYGFKHIKDKSTDRVEEVKKIVVILKQMSLLYPDAGDERNRIAVDMLRILDRVHHYSISVGPPQN